MSMCLHLEACVFGVASLTSPSAYIFEKQSIRMLRMDTFCRWSCQNGKAKHLHWMRTPNALDRDLIGCQVDLVIYTHTLQAIHKQPNMTVKTATANRLV